MSHKTKYSSLEGLSLGTAAYVVAHAGWQKSRGRGPSLPYGKIKNPKKAFRDAKGIVTLQCFEALSRWIPDLKAADEGEKLFKAGKYEEAIPPLKSATEQWSDVEFPHMLGLAYAQQTKPNYAASIEAFLTALHKPDATLYYDSSSTLHKDFMRVLDAAVGQPEIAAPIKRLKSTLDADPDAHMYGGGLNGSWREFHAIVHPKNTVLDGLILAKRLRPLLSVTI